MSFYTFEPQLHLLIWTIHSCSHSTRTNSLTMKIPAALLLSLLVAATMGAPHLPVYSGVSHAHHHVPAGYNHQHGYNLHHLGYNTVGHVKPGHVFTGYNQVHAHLPAYAGSVVRSG